MQVISFGGAGSKKTELHWLLETVIVYQIKPNQYLQTPAKT